MDDKQTQLEMLSIDNIMIFAIINFGSFVIACLIMGYLYILSIQPIKRAKTRGEKAWKESKTFRTIGGILEAVSVTNLILWIWFPLPIVSAWIINSNIWVGIIIAIVITIPCSIILGLGIKAAGTETLSPSKDTEMYGGIYNYIRHPQSLGEFPLFMAVSFAINSWFLVLISFLFIALYMPIMIYYEEKDLVKRFGDKYRDYQKNTGALFPKLRK